MTTRFDCSLNGVSLSGLDERICVTGILEKSPQRELTTLSLMNLEGERLLACRRKFIQVEITLALRERDPARRRALLALLPLGGDALWLTVSTRPGQRLRVVPEEGPDPDTDWTADIRLVFRSVGDPRWEDIQVESLEASGTLPLTLTVPAGGNTAAVPEGLRITNTGNESISEMTLKTGSACQLLTGLALAPGEELTASRDEWGFISLKIQGEEGTRHADMCLTGDSDEELAFSPEEDSLTVTGDGTVTVTMELRRRWL